MRTRRQNKVKLAKTKTLTEQSACTVVNCAQHTVGGHETRFWVSSAAASAEKRDAPPVQAPLDPLIPPHGMIKSAKPTREN